MRRSLVVAAVLFSTLPLSAQSAVGPIGSPDEVFRAWLDRTDLGRMLKRDTEKLRVVKAANGAEMVVLGEGFQDVLVATVDDKGNTVTTCIGTVEGARAIFAAKTPRERKP